jgi:hypothetical protein
MKIVKSGKFIVIGELRIPLSDRRNYVVKNRKSDSVIGQIIYYPRWRQYVLCPVSDTVWNNDCLQFVTDFLKELKKPGNKQLRGQNYETMTQDELR